MEKILVIEDDKDIAELVEFNLKAENFRVEVCHNGREGLQRAQKGPPDLILLDLMLPDLNGLEICKELKRDNRTKHVPIMMVTAKGAEVDRVVGFELGADDYLTKPFSTRELALRVKAILRRVQGKGQEPPGEVAFGILSLDPAKYEVKVKGQATKLTALEFKLLKYLFDMKGRVATRDMLLDRVWGYDSELNTRTVDTHIKRLREKLGEAGKYIETLRGLGYRFVDTVSPE
jgi:two-component system phosphate regulon response regulator PhoB